MHPDYLEKVLNAQVYDVAIETPLDLAGNLSARVGNRILLKREDLQPVFSFKLRGAYNKIASLSAEKLKRGVICASAGNHAQGVALSAAKLGCRAVIVMPTSTPGIKIEAVKRRGGEVVLHGDSYDEAYAHALELGKIGEADFRPPVRRSRSDRRPGHHRDGNPASALAPQRADPRHLLLRRRRRADRRRGRLHQAPAPGNQDHRRRGQGCRCDDAVAGQGPSRPSASRSACSPTARRSSSSARKPSACARNTSTR